MNISIDGGALCAKESERYGNYIYSYSLITALSQYDRSNNYTVYSFCNNPIARNLPSNFLYKKMLPRKFWMKGRVTLEEVVQQNDIFLALNQSSPIITRSKIISVSHGLSFMFYPQLYPQRYSALRQQLNEMLRKSALVLVSSGKVKNEIGEFYPDFASKVVVIPFGIPADFSDFREEPREDYFMFVGMNAPVKNIEFIIKCFRLFVSDKKYKHFKLYIVGNNYTSSAPSIVTIPQINRNELKLLYRKSTGYLTASFYESFNFPVLEALSQNCPVIGKESAIIPELRPYISVVDSLEIFVDSMKKEAQHKPRSIHRQNLKKLFSWQTYAKRLISLYCTI